MGLQEKIAKLEASLPSSKNPDHVRKRLNDLRKLEDVSEAKPDSLKPDLELLKFCDDCDAWMGEDPKLGIVSCEHLCRSCGGKKKPTITRVFLSVGNCPLKYF